MAMTQPNRSSRPARPNKLFTIDAQQLMRVGMLRQAVEVCKRGLVYHPHHVTGYVILAQAYRELGQADRAVNVLRDGFRRTGAEQLDHLRAIFAGEVIESAPVQEIETVRAPADAPSAVPESSPSGDVVDRNGTADAHHEPAVIEADAREGDERMPESPAGQDADAFSGVHEQTVDAEERPVDIVELAVETELPAEPVSAENVPAPGVPASAVAEETEQPAAVPEVRVEAAGVVEEEEAIVPEEAGEEMTASAVVASMSAPDDEVLHAESCIQQESMSGEGAAVADESIDETVAPIGRSTTLEAAEPESVVEPEAVAEPETAAKSEVVAEPEAAADLDAVVELEAAPELEAALELEAVPEIEALVGIDMISEIEAAAGLSTEEPVSDVEQEPEAADEEESASEPPAAPSVEAEPASRIEPAAPPVAADAPEGRSALTLIHDAGEHHHRRSGHAGMLIGSEASLERERTLSLATHAGHNRSRLRSSNLRLIPGLEFAPLRHEDQVRRQPIAPLIHGTMPELTRAVRTNGEHLHHPESIPLPESELSAASEVEITIESVVRHAAAPTSPSRIDAPRMSPKPPVQERKREEPPAEHATTRETQSTRVAEAAAEERRSEGLTPLEELARRLEKARIPVVEEPVTRESSARTFEPTIVSETLANILLTQGAYQEALKAFRTLARTRADRMEYFQEKIREIERRIEEQRPE